MMTLDQPAFSAYRAKLSKSSKLTPELERELSLRFRDGDKEAGRLLIEACLPFVLAIAFEYRRWGIPLEDIVQEGNIGLLKAAARYDADRGCRLATYASYWIRAEIREFVVRGYRIVRLGSSKSERRALRLYRRTREKDPELLAEGSGLSTQRATALLPLLMAGDVSIDLAPVDGVAPVEKLASSAMSPEDEAVDADSREHWSRALAQAVDELPPREQRIVKWRWLTDNPRTLEQIGTLLGVSKERVRQIEVRAKKLMRARIEELTREPMLAESA